MRWSCSVSVGVTALSCMSLVACSAATQPTVDLSPREGDGTVGAWVRAGLYNRSYQMHTPPGFDATDSTSARYPLLLVLHGAGDTGAGLRARIAVDSATDAGGFVTVYPDGLEATWTVGCGECTRAERLHADDVAFLNTLVRQLAGALPVDSTRVFVAGFSQGGQLAQLYACESPVPPAGIAVVSALPYRVAADACAPAGRFPVLVVHGTQDPIIPYLGDSAILSAEATVQLWTGLMGCTGAVTREDHPDSARDGTTYTTFSHAGCARGATVLFERVNGAGHSWPGRNGPWADFTGRHSHNLDTGAEMVRLFTGMVEESQPPGARSTPQ